MTTTTSGSTSAGYLAVHVTGALTEGSRSAFLEATIENARNSVLEPGVARFDVLIGDDDTFLLVEVYRDGEAPARHKETAHYAAWREAVADMMAQPRSATKYETVFPVASHWSTPPSAAETPPPLSSSSSAGLTAVIVDVGVAAGQEEAFVAASLDNCRNSVREAGVARFDLVRDTEEPSRFALVEVYRNAEAAARHKETAHYLRWRERVADMMARPRKASTYRTAFPAPLFWDATALEVDDVARPPGLAGVDFSFVSPRLRVGRGVAASLPQILADIGASRPLVVTGASGLARHAEALGPETIAALEKCPRFEISGEPTVDDAVAAAELAKECDSVVAMGGGSALDLGKAAAALATNLGTDLDGKPSTVYAYVEAVGEGKAVRIRPLPTVAVPTTAGTGSEVTKNAVLRAKGRKASMRADSMLPEVAVVDPRLTLSCPARLTAHVGLDALCQNLEPFVSCMATPMVDAIAREGMVRAARSLRAAVANGADEAAREDLSLASLFGGFALANAKLGAVHGFAGVLGGAYDAPHGALCAALLAPVFRANVAKLQQQLDDDDDKGALLDRFVEVSRLLTGSNTATPADGAVWLEALVEDLDVPGLRVLCAARGGGGGENIDDDQTLAAIVSATAQASSTKGNPVHLDHADLESILRAAL
ncbi:hypothetical protein CTAYLR_010200 [Chrysophaeum taylorii]|uniref:ABM domain-containing protein n=1 Tax=Chrysophaeum taylorii TaxID=2483200 RepID=A0AAD7UDP3_9STRA|nr:hypothetical protein CTAYLR_010200 [Chrysophaeum taylorii]